MNASVKEEENNSSDDASAPSTNESVPESSESSDRSQPCSGSQKTPEDDFSEFLWMENEEEFDQQVRSTSCMISK